MILLQEIKAPLDSVNDDTLLVIELKLSDGDKVVSGDVIIELETSKAIVTIEAEVDGVIKYLCEEGSDINVGHVLANIYDELPISNNEEQILDKTYDKKEVIAKPLISKKALNMIRKNGINIDDINHDGIISTRDIDIQYEGRSVGNQKIAMLPSDGKEDIIEYKYSIEKISKTKGNEIKSLSGNYKSILNSSLFLEITTDSILNSIRFSNLILKETILHIVVFETSRLLAKYKELNGFYLEDKRQFYNDINIGIAMDDGINGLKVASLHNANNKNIFEIESEIISLSDKYSNNKLGPNDVSDITFVITDLSSENISFFIPMINSNNSCILGISREVSDPETYILSATFDHRMSSGKYVAEFLNELKNNIESFSFSNSTPQNAFALKTKCSKCNKILSDDLNGIGFIKTTLKNGKEAFICQSCLLGN